MKIFGCGYEKRVMLELRFSKRLIDLICDPEDGGSTLALNVGELLEDLEDQVAVFMSFVTGCPIYTLRHRVPFSSLSTTRRATVEVF
jgi:hypothetical protein